MVNLANIFFTGTEICLMIKLFHSSKELWQLLHQVVPTNPMDLLPMALGEPNTVTELPEDLTWGEGIKSIYDNIGLLGGGALMSLTPGLMSIKCRHGPPGYHELTVSLQEIREGEANPAFKQGCWTFQAHTYWEEATDTNELAGWRIFSVETGYDENFTGEGALTANNYVNLID